MYALNDCMFKVALSQRPSRTQSTRLSQLRKHHPALHALEPNSSGIDHAEARHAHSGSPHNAHLCYPFTRSYGSAACECQKRSSPDIVMRNMQHSTFSIQPPAFSIVGRHVGAQFHASSSRWVAVAGRESPSSRHRHCWFIDFN